MKADVEEPDSTSIGYGKRLNRSVKVLVIDRVLIMPEVVAYVRDFVGNECKPIVSRIGLDLNHRRARPGNDGRPHSHRASSSRKCESRRAAYVILTVGGVVVHVALPGMSLAPVVLMLGDVLRLGKIGRPGIERCVQVIDFHQNPVRCASVRVAGMVVRRRRRISPREKAGKRIYPGP